MNRKSLKNKIIIGVIIVFAVIVFSQIILLVEGNSSIESDLQYVIESARLTGRVEKYTKLVLAGILDRRLENDIDRIIEKTYYIMYEEDINTQAKETIKLYRQGWDGLKVISNKYVELEDEEEKRTYMGSIINHSESLWVLGEKSMNYILYSSESKLSFLRIIGISIFYITLLTITLIILFRWEWVETLREETIFDPLTNAYNRRYLDEIILKEKSRVDRGAKTFSLIVCDIDFFKNVNDTFGHNMGDEVLVEFSRRIKNLIRNEDVFVRLGGEEFLCFLRDTQSGEAFALAERIRVEIGEEDFIGAGKVTASFGITEYAPIEDTELTLARADRALYDAKENGRNQTMVLIKPNVETGNIEDIV